MYLARLPAAMPRLYFDRAIARAADHALLIEEGVGPAIEKMANSSSTFSLNSPPTASLICVEALLRWNRNGVDVLTPDEFIPVAESLHQIIPLGRWVPDSAMTQLARWRERLARCAGRRQPIEQSVPLRLIFVDSVLAALERHGLTGASLELELTERMLMGNDPTMRVALTRLRDAGITLASTTLAPASPRCHGCVPCR